MSLGLAVAFDATLFTEAAPGAGVGDPPVIPSQPNSATNDDVPAVWDVAVNGHGYMLDLQPGGQSQFRHESIPTLRQAFITADTLGEIDLNPESLWRFSDRDWSHGAGQIHADFTTSDTSQFRSSKGVNVWNKWQLSMLPDTTQLRASTNTNLRMVVAGGFLYLADGNTVRRTADGITWTAVTGTPAAAVTGLATDGVNVWAAYTSNGVWTFTGAGAASQLVTSAVTPSAIGYVNGRLMVAVGAALYNITSPTAAVLPTALFTHPNSTFAWVGFSDGLSAFYAAGFAGSKSEVWRTTINAAGTGLNAPIPATPGIPTGEILNTIGFYLGFVFLGSNLGVRMCSPDADGNLQIGALIEAGACRCIEGQSRFVWFGWENYDTTSTGLGRLDLTVVKDNGAPAYASDLMVTVQSQVTAVTTFLGLRVFAVSGLGVYTESTSLVPQATLDSGLISFDLPDEKIALYLIIKRLSTAVGTVKVLMAVDSGPWQLIGVLSGDTIKIPELRGSAFEVRLELVRDAVTTVGPGVQRITLEALETVNSGMYLYAPIMLSETVQVHGGGEKSMNVVDERDFLYALRASSDRVIYQELSSSFPVTVEDIQWSPQQRTTDNKGFNGTVLLKMKTI